LIIYTQAYSGLPQEKSRTEHIHQHRVAVAVLQPQFFIRTVMTFNRSYFIPAVLLLLTEILIALFVHDKIIRPYIGDFLVVIMLYCFAKSFINISPWKIAVAVFLFACFIEFLQWLGIAEKLGIGKIKIANIILGSHFEWADILMYTAGIASVLIWENVFGRG
jgi:hypothetical protein